MTSFNDIVFIINPNSGKKQISDILDYLKKNNPEIEFFISDTFENFKNFVEKNIQNYNVFVIVGGDGTINSSVNYFYRFPEKILAVVPTGSGNGFANEMGFNKNIKSLLHDISERKTVEIDLLEVNGTKFINILGIGFDSYVAHDFNNRKKRGLKTYIASVIKSIFTYKPISVELRSKGTKIKGKYNMLVVANAAQFGNHARIVPKAKPNSGFFILASVKPFPVFYYPVFVFKLMTGKLKNSKYLEYTDIKETLTINTSFQKYHVDGEPKTTNKELVIRILPKKIKFIKTKQCKL